MAATCPACGVAVVPGYVRCPKCQAPLPMRTARTTQSPGGTAIEEQRPFPARWAAVGAVLALAVFAVIAWSRRPDAVPRPAAPVAVTADDDGAPEPATQPVAAATPDLDDPPPTAGPDAGEVAATLEGALKKQRLWSTVEVIGSRVDVRTSACADPAMGPTLDGAMPALKAAGIVKLRCLAKSGSVELDRDL